MFWNMLLLPSKRVRSGEPAVFHGTFVDPHSSVLVIASRVKCTPSLLAAHTPSGVPFTLHTRRSLSGDVSSCLVVFGSWLWCHLAGRVVETILGHSCVVASLSLALTLTFTCISLTSFLFLEWPILPLAPDLGAWTSFSLKSKNFALKCLTVGHFPQLLLGFWA